jgi:hypothetical protein
MKLAKTFVFSFAIVALSVLVLDANVFSFSGALVGHLEKFVNKKMSADGYPLAVFFLLLTSACVELMLLFKLNVKWLLVAREKTKQRLIKIGGGLLGGLMSLTGLTYARGSIDEAKLGISLAFVVAIYVAAPLFIAGVLHMLREPDLNPTRMKLIRRLAALTYSAIALVSVWGIVKTSA